jgi:hypothetical protein
MKAGSSAAGRFAVFAEPHCLQAKPPAQMASSKIDHGNGRKMMLTVKEFKSGK